MAGEGRVLFCACVNGNIVPQSVRRRVLAALEANGAEVWCVPDLCGLAARRDPMLRQVAGAGGLTVAACHPRAVKWLLSRAGVDVADTPVRVANMRSGDVDEVLRVLLGRETDADAEAALPDVDNPGGWIPWFPVIDYDRCKNCRQCLDFCLFGVYETDGEDRVRVVQPQQCKNYCPACARICPEAAIIFPKINEAPINGADIDDEEAVRANANLNVDKMLGGDVYAALAERKKKRQRMLLLRKRTEEDG